MLATTGEAAGIDVKQRPSTEQAVRLLKQAARTGAVPSAQVCGALVQLEKEKLADASYEELVGGGPGGKRWKLIFSAGSKDSQEAKKGRRGGGFYFPITAVQRFCNEESVIENGIYLGQISALQFSGPFDYKKNKLSFDFTKLRLRLGPKWFNFQIKSQKKDKAGPFFLIVYADDEIVVARGRGGGIALWQRTTPAFELKAGISL